MWGLAIVVVHACLSHANISRTKWDRCMVTRKVEWESGLPDSESSIRFRHFGCFRVGTLPIQTEMGSHQSRHSTGTACFVVYIECIVVYTASLKEKENTTTLGTVAGLLSSRAIMDDTLLMYWYFYFQFSQSVLHEYTGQTWFLQVIGIERCFKLTYRFQWYRLWHSVLCAQATFPQLYQELQLRDTALWSTYSRSSQCEQELPPYVCKKLSAFQQLLVVQATRPDRLQSAMTRFACKALGSLPLTLSVNHCMMYYSMQMWLVASIRS